MAYEESAVKTICEWLEQHAGHVIDVCAGPRREDWFNAEAFVALSHKASVDSFVVYGEQRYSTVLRGTAILADAADRGKLPDVIGFIAASPGCDIDFIIESKVILGNDPPAWRNAVLCSLRDQAARAKRCCESSAALGLIYLISAAGPDVAPEPFYESVAADLTSVLSGLNWRWLRAPSSLYGLRLRSTSFAYPATHLSVGVAAFAVD
jgi:hypothetical protein